jgi:hypothetical protein
MASDESKDRVEEALEALEQGDGQGGEAIAPSQRRAFEQLAAQVEEPTLQDRILKRYLGVGRDLLADSRPAGLDPRLARSLEPMLGDVSDIRVHTGKLASEAARSMDARAFALGDRDIFIDSHEFNPDSLSGQALLAHEVAHTRDAATGFAMSSQRGGSRSGREELAHAVEERFSRAQRTQESAEPVADGAPARPNETAAKVDKAKLARMILDVMKLQDRRAGERFGR